MSKYSFLKPCRDGVYLKIYLQPGAKKDSIVGVHGDALKISVASPPIEGKANKNLIEFLSKILRIEKSRIEIKSGVASRKKLIKITAAALEDIEGMVP